MVPDLNFFRLENFLTLNFFNLKIFEFNFPTWKFFLIRNCSTLEFWVYFSSMIKMVFNDHSILLNRDYYYLIMDYNHDIRLKLFPTFSELEISRLWTFSTLNFFSSIFINDQNGIQWSFNTTTLGFLLINHGL